MTSDDVERRLIPDSVSVDLREALETLCRYAEEGVVTGIAYTCILANGHHIANAAGEAHVNPVLARGTVGSLNDHLGCLVRGEPSPFHLADGAKTPPDPP